jgi:hypothetical protein
MRARVLEKGVGADGPLRRLSGADDLREEYGEDHSAQQKDGKCFEEMSSDEVIHVLPQMRDSHARLTSGQKAERGCPSQEKMRK